MRSSSFILLYCALYSVLHTASGIIYHINPHLPNTSCLEQNCLTLSQFATKTNFSDSTVTLVFQPGKHNLSTLISITGIDHYTVIGTTNTQGVQTASILCDSSGSIQMSRITSVTIVNMHFIGCGNTIIDGVNHFKVENSTIEGNINSETALVLRGVKNATIIRSHFLANTNGKYLLQNFLDYEFTTVTVRVGGAIIASRSTLEITESAFEGNGAGRGGAIYAEDNSKITISRSNATSNSALNGGSVLSLEGGCVAMVTVSNFSGNNGTVLSMHDSGLLTDSSIFYHNEGSVVNSNQGNISINQSLFYNNIASGGMIYAFGSNITIEYSNFTMNEVSDDRGIIFTYNCFIDIINSDFNNNLAKEGVIVSHASLPLFLTTIYNCTFQHNRGTVISSGTVNVHIDFCLFQNNSGGYVANMVAGGQLLIEAIISNSVFRYHKGDILYLSGSEYFIHNCMLEFNGGIGYGLIFIIYGNMTISESSFQSNYFEGLSIIHAWYTDVKLLESNTFHDNSFLYYGGVIFIRGGSIVTTGTLNVTSNTAMSTVVVITDSRALFSGNINFEDNNGSFYAYSSNVTFLGSIAFVNQKEDSRGDRYAFFGLETTRLQVAGSITGVYSNLNFHGSVKLTQNSAISGGAILTIESRITINSDSTVSITNNSVLENGGGISLYKSIWTIFGNCTLEGNTAQMNGGGIYAISSSITVASNTASPTHFLALISNTANRGGGIYLASSQLTILKSTDTDITTAIIDLYVNLTNNIAHEFGGGFFVDDETNARICNNTVSKAQSLGSDCFLQVTDTFEISRILFETQPQVLFMSNNSAGSGSNIYGGLLDRCTVSAAARLRIGDIQVGNLDTRDIKNGISILKEAGNLTDLNTLASDPVQMCLCLNNQPDCSYKHHTMKITKGGSFVIPVVAVDHVNHTVQATIISRVSSLTGDLGEGQRFQTISTNCTDLRFNVFSSAATEKLILYAEGPCGGAQPSQATIDISFLPCECPIGFEPLSEVQETRCECVCSSNISDWISNCTASTGFVMKTTNFWIDYTDQTNPPGFITHPYCPYDYCVPVSSQSGVRIDFNSSSEGTDAQCNYNHAGILCGACRNNFSLSLGSSHCLECPSHWYVLTAVILLSILLGGLLLVTLLFVLNITVAVGTINGLIFYANMIAANKTIFFTTVSFPYLVISWFNLELGIDVCFFDGMDTHGKAWVELILPTYIIIIVVAIVILSKYSQRFSHLIGKRNPVAVLATLILLSYAKYLQTIIVAFSATILHYPDGKSKLLWLPDATLGYFAGRRVPLFIMAVGILITGLIYTLLLFSWQWIIRHVKLKATRNPKLRSFMETYTAPYNDNHRYWTGLLLFARVLLYLISASNVQGDPQVPLITTAVIAAALLFLKSLLGGRVYIEWPIDILETILYFNLLFLSIMTLRNIERNEDRDIIVSLSITFIFLVLLGVVMYHSYVYIIQQFIKKRKPDNGDNGNNVTKKLRESVKLPSCSDDDRFKDVVGVFDSPSTVDYRINQASSEMQVMAPTTSTVDPPKNIC